MHIEFFPMLPQAKLFPPEPLKKIVPDWYKNAPVEPPGHKERPSAKEMQMNPDIQAATIKRCIPVQDYITSGYILKNFLDVYITQEVDEHGRETVYPFHNTRLGRPFIDRHKRGQHSGISINKEVLKISGVWGIKTPPGYSCFFYQPYYHSLNSDIEFLPSIVDTDNYFNPVSLPFVCKDIEANSSREIYLESGMPLVCVYPFKRDEWQMTISKNDLTDDKSRITILTQLHQIYKRFFHSKKRFN